MKLQFSITICVGFLTAGWNVVTKGKSLSAVLCLCGLRRLKRVFRCCSVCETMEDYKEGYLIVWTNYMSPCSSIVGLYLKGTYDVISVTMATCKVHKRVL